MEMSAYVYRRFVQTPPLSRGATCRVSYLAMPVISSQMSSSPGLRTLCIVVVEWDMRLRLGMFVLDDWEPGMFLISWLIYVIILTAIG